MSDQQFEITTIVLARQKELLQELDAIAPEYQDDPVFKVHRASTIAWIEDLENQLFEFELLDHVRRKVVSLLKWGASQQAWVWEQKSYSR